MAVAPARDVLVGDRPRRPGPGRLGRRADLGRPAQRTSRLGPAARPGRPDGPGSAAGARLRSGPPGQAASAGRLHLVHAGGLPRRHHHLGVRRRAAPGDARDALAADCRLPGHAAGRRAARCACSWSCSPASRRPGAGCATSPGTCCTSTPTSASAWRCRTSCGRASSSSASTAKTLFWWTAWALAAAAVLVWRVGLPLLAQPAPPAPGDLGRRTRARHLVGLPHRPPPGPAAGSRPASSSPGASWPVRAGPARTRTRSPPHRTAAASGSPSRTSATAAPRRRALRPGTRVLVEGPYGRLSARAAHPSQGRADRRRGRHHARCARWPRASRYAPGEAILVERFSRPAALRPRARPALPRARAAGAAPPRPPPAPGLLAR